MTEMESWVLGTGYTGSDRKLTQERERKEDSGKNRQREGFRELFWIRSPRFDPLFSFFCVVLYCASFGLNAYSAELESSLKGRWIVVAGVDFFCLLRVKYGWAL